MCRMEIPIATRVGNIEQREHELRLAEQELGCILHTSDFSMITDDRDSTVRRILAYPTLPYDHPIMNTIAKAYLKVQKCKEELDTIREMEQLTLLQIKMYVIELERKTESRITELETIVRKLQEIQCKHTTEM